MGSPFPGMDPFIEACGLWRDFHDALIREIRAGIEVCLPDRYVVRYGDRTSVEFIDSELRGVHRKAFEPDLSIKHTQPATSAPLAGGVALADPETLTMHGLSVSEERQIFLDISQVVPERRLVTSIEVLSPSNRVAGSQGWQLYNEKRNAFLSGYANLVEVDLLRGGKRMPMREPWPNSPYTILVMRKEAAPRCQVWPAFHLQRLPRLVVPLAPPDADISFELQPLIEAIYAKSRYGLDIDYSQAIHPPLGDAELKWLKDRLTEK